MRQLIGAGTPREAVAWRADMAVFSFCSRPPGPCWWHGGARKAARRLSPPHSSSGSESRKKPLNQRADKHLGNLVGYFVSTIGSLNQIVHLWGYESLADMETRRAARDADPAWKAYGGKTVGFIVSQETKILKPTSFSPIR